MPSNQVTDLETFDIRYTDMEDGEALGRWLDDPSLLRWFPMDGGKEKDLMVTNWIGFSKYKCSLTAVFEGRPVGVATLFLMPYRKIAHLALVYLAVDPEMRGKGVATSLIRNIKNLGKNYFRLRSVHFEIMADSPLKPILLRQGFEEIVVQENFYKREGHGVARVLMESIL